MKREEFTYQTNIGEFVAEKLLLCPFCGGEPEFVTIGNDYTKSRKAEIKCTKCFCKRTTGAIHNNLEWCGRKAIELWNKRTADLSLPPAEGAKKVQWSGYGELGNIKPRPQTKGDFDDVLKKDNKCVCGAELKHRGGISFWCDNPHCKTAYVFDADGHISEYGTVERKGTQRQAVEGAGHHFASKEIEQPTAEGAEEMLKAVFNEIWDAPVPDDVFENPDYRMSFADAKIVAEKFATLHAQRLAEKMVSERLREELIAYDKWVGEKYIDNYRHEIAPAIVDEYLKSRQP